MVRSSSHLGVLRDGWPLSKERSCAIAGFKLGDVPALERRGVEVRKRDCPAEGWITVQIRTPPLARGREPERVLFGPEKGLLGVEKK